MNKLEYFLKIEERMKRESETEILVEVNFFTYTYELGITRVSYNGEEYLCFPNFGQTFLSPPYSEEEEKLINEGCHVYFLGEEIVCVEDARIKAKIFEIYQVQRKKSCGEQ